MENPIKMDDLGVPLFLEAPIYGINLVFFCWSLVLTGSLDRLTWTTLQSQTTDFVAPIYRQMFVDRQPLHHQVREASFVFFDVFLGNEFLCVLWDFVLGKSFCSFFLVEFVLCFFSQLQVD